MKMNFRTVALIYSLNTPAEVTIIEMIGNNKYLAKYQDHVCAAMFNPFSGTFYVDDVHAMDAKDFHNKEGDLQYELNYLFNASQRELDAYKKIGSVQHLQRLREQEVTKRRHQKMFREISRHVLTWAGLAFCAYVFISGIISIFA